MTMTALPVEPIGTEGTAGEPEPGDPTAQRAQNGFVPLLAMGAGLMVLALAAAVFLFLGDRGGSRPVADAGPGAGAAEAPVPEAGSAELPALTVSARDVSIVSQVYEPGEDSGWHSHSGIHAVAVLSGAITVYDGGCQARVYEPGQPYVGGQELHRVRNEGSSPAVMAVTYLAPSTGNGQTRHQPAPAGCAVGG